MSIVNAAGNILTKAELTALTTPVVVPDKLKLTAPVYETYSEPGAKKFEGGKRLKYRAGQIVTQAEIDEMYAASNASFTSVTPNTGLAAGNTPVTIKGRGFAGVEGVDFGGVAATNVNVSSDATITCNTPPHAAGAVNVVIHDASGDVTANAAYTYS